MKNALQGLATQAITLIGLRSPFAKAISAALTGFATSLINMALAGSYNLHSLELDGLGILTAAVVYLTKNTPKPVAKPAAAAPAKPSK